MKKIFLFVSFLVGVSSLQAAEESPIRLGLVGLGNHMTEKLIPAIDPEKFQLAYGCRRNLEELVKQKATYGLSSITTDYNFMLSSGEVDAIVVSGTPDLHREVAKAALDHGIHVFAEKPLSLSLEHVRTLAQLADQKSNVISIVGFNMSYIPSIDPLKEKVRQKDLHNLVLKSTLGTPLNPQESLKQTFETSLYFAFIHSVAFMVDLMGIPKDLQVDCQKGAHPQSFSLNVKATYELENQVCISFANCCVPGGFIFTASYDDKDGSHIIDTTQKKGSQANEKQLSYRNELNAFHESIKSGQLHKNNFKRTLEIHEVLEKIRSHVDESIFFS